MARRAATGDREARAARAAELRAELEYHAERYYVHDDPVIGDVVYDAV